MVGVVWVLSFAGMLVALVAASVLFKRNVNATHFLAAIERLMDRGQFMRARKLCRAVSTSAIGRVTEVALALRLEPTVLREGDEADYRNAPEMVPLEDRAREALEPAARKELERALRIAVAAAAGGAMAAGSFWPPWPLVPTIAGAAGVLLALLSLVMHASIQSGVELALVRLPQLVRPGDEMHGEDPASTESLLVLSVVSPDGERREERFEQSVVKVGRMPTSHLVLDHSDVSRMHAVIEQSSDGVTLVDLGSAAGTTVNGRKAIKAHLHPGDEIAIGPFRLVVQSAP